MELITKSTDLELQKFDSDLGQLSAYVTTFGNADVVGDIMAPGALDKFVNEFNDSGRKLAMLWNHKADEPIGVWNKFEINSRGVKGFGEIFTDVTRGNDTRNLIKRGVVGSVSVGFVSNKFEQLESGGRLFKEIELREVSVVLSPANPKAKITSAKREDGSVDLKLVAKLLRNAGLSHSEAKSLIAEGQTSLRNVVDEEAKKQEMAAQLLKNWRS